MLSPPFPHRIISQAPPDRPPAVAGGVALHGSDLLFHPGRFASLAEEGHLPGWDLLVEMRKARYAWGKMYMKGGEPSLLTGWDG